MAPVRRSSAQVALKASGSGIVADQLLLFRDTIAPALQSLNRDRTQKVDSEVVARFSRTFSDGTYEEVALERFHPTAADEPILTCVTRVEGPKSFFPTLAAPTNRKRSLTKANEDAGVTEGEENTADTDDGEYQPPARKTRAVGNADDADAGPVRARVTRNVTGTSSSSPQTEKSVKRKKSAGTRTSKKGKESADAIPLGQLERGMSSLDVQSQVGGRIDEENDDGKSDSTIVTSQPPTPLGSSSRRK